LPIPLAPAPTRTIGLAAAACRDITLKPQIVYPRPDPICGQTVCGQRRVGKGPMTDATVGIAIVGTTITGTYWHYDDSYLHPLECR
jgi:hypothetical protein